jgi:hypothetical protein
MQSIEMRWIIADNTERIADCRIPKDHAIQGKGELRPLEAL